MKFRSFAVVLASALAAAITIFVVLIEHWQHRQPAFKDAPKLISAMKIFSRELTARGQPLPACVSLRELVHGGYISASDVRAFDGMEVTVFLIAHETRPQNILMHVRMPDGSMAALMADGSVQSLPP